MGSSRPWIDTATNLIKQSRDAEEAVWVDHAVAELLRKHPDCGLSPAELADIVRQLVINQRWSLTSG